MRTYEKSILTGAVSAGLIVALSLLMATSSAPAWADGLGGSQITVNQDTVTSTPYDLTLSPNGEFRVIHFDAGLVSSVLVAKPWLLTVLIQGNDVVLQSKATSGDTQLVVYVGAVGTLWHVTIGAHGAVATRILVRAPGAEPVTMSTPTPPQPTTVAVTTQRPTIGPNPQLTAFLSTLSAAQRAGWNAWQKSPSGTGLADWVAGLSPAQQTAFNTLVQEGIVTVPSILGAQPGVPAIPPMVDTTTVLGQQPTMAPTIPPATAVPVRPMVAGASDPVGNQTAPVSGVVVTGAPEGVLVTATAAPTAKGIEVRYTIHNGLTVDLGNAEVTATDGVGHDATVAGIPTRKIAAGQDFSGTVIVQATHSPITLKWTWGRWAHAKTWFVTYSLPNGMIHFTLTVS
ncbi:MAG TPA: hypothetical protein VKZ50_04090 [bacterium]|nr:hypothetical protein [bacterium]